MTDSSAGSDIESSARTLEQALAREMLVSERLRVTLLAAFMAVVLALYVLSAFVVTEGTALLTRGLRGALIGLWGAALAYELVARTVFGRYLRAGRQPPELARYVNAFIEISLPTVATVLLAEIGNPVSALFLPATSFYFLFIILATLRLSFWLSAFTGAVAAVQYTIVAAVYTQQIQAVGLPIELTAMLSHVGRALLFLATGMVAGLVSLQIRRQLLNSFRSVEERNRVVNMFGQHVSPAVVEKLLSQDLDLEGEVRHVCLMFLDIRDFTAFSSGRRPEEVVSYLNVLFDELIDVVNRHRGIVNKFLGDGFMAVFGAPISDGRDIHDAVEAALEIVQQVEALNASGRIAPTRIGIGLHAGEAVTGNVGSVVRKEYTIIGDTVNLASRIEQLNKQFDSRVLVSEAVHRAIDGAALSAQPLGPVAVRGQAAPVQVYRLA